MRFGPDGDLYGTTSNGGTDHDGTVFQMEPNPDGTWSEVLMHDFLDGDPLGISPVGSVTFDGRGNLYSTTFAGGHGSYGTVFELTPTAHGWTGSVLHTFLGGLQGGSAAAGVLLDGANIYGTVANGGSGNAGAVFGLGRGSVRNWYELVLYSFGGGQMDGPGTLVSDRAGNLYGVSNGNWGTVYELIPNRGASGWTYKTLHQFDDGLDGGDPNGDLILDSAGNLYGTTSLRRRLWRPRTWKRCRVQTHAQSGRNLERNGNLPLPMPTH